MAAIEIDDDLYAYIASKTQRIGEPASVILRRLLGLDPSTVKSGENHRASHELSDAVTNPVLLTQAANKRFLFILSEAYKQRGQDFERLLLIRGHNRIYFSKSKDEIKSSGQSTRPKQIPNSEYWVMTNASNDMKASILRDALNTLGYSVVAVNAACEVVKRAR